MNTPLPPARLWTAHLICVLAMVTWSSGLPANTFLMPTLHPMALAAARMILAAAVLMPFWLWLDGWDALRKANWKMGIAVGSFVGFGSLLVIAGQSLTDAVTVAVISAALPVIGVVIEIVLDGRKITLPLVLGLRPEHLSLSGPGTALPARVSHVEPTGAQTHLLLDFAGVNLVAVINDFCRLKRGDDLQVGIDPSRLHVFSDASGHRLGD